MVAKKDPKSDRVLIILHYFMHKSKLANRRDFSNKKAQKMLFLCSSMEPSSSQ